MRHIFQRLLPRRLWLAGLPCLALLGCVQSHNKPAIDTLAEEKIPVYQLADYLSTECSDIWALQGKSTETNPLYWLRAMDCADRLMPAQSRQQARQYDDGSWQKTFKQGILLADAKITPYERRQLVARIDALSTEIPAQVRPLYQLWREAIVTRSPLMLRLLEQARLVAQSDVSVLINGQSGTGKEIFAQAIHNASPRNSKPFIAINCGALPEQLLESELFGHARGAFTGAVSNREGLFQAAEGGTLFLDEIGDMPAPLQVKLLRVLQERKVRPLGSNRDIDINVRIISATHRDLPKAMARGEFREDLYYRLNVVSLKIPALAERTEDIPLLANHLLRQAAERHKPFVRAFSTDAMKRLMTASWPGNVRQLVNVIEQCVALTSSPVISDALVEQALEGENTALPTFVEARNQFELNYLRKLLQITKGNVTHAARMAGRNRTEFYKLLSRHELDANDFKE